MSRLTNEEQINAAEDIVVRRGRALGVDEDLLLAAQVFQHHLRAMQECLRWAGGQRIGPGGIAHAELSTIMSSASRGEDWKAMRETYLTRKRR